MKYADLFVEWLEELGYTHCFFVAGGNSMHLLDGARQRMTCVPFVHEGAAGVAAEYFNEAGGAGSAFVLVTAGPGLTNLVTALAGAYLESRELLVVGGQVKSTDLADGGIRQRGIQEVDGVAIVAPVTVRALQLREPIARAAVAEAVERGRNGRKGPVFLEVCLDAQGAPVQRSELEHQESPAPSLPDGDDLGLATEQVVRMMEEAERPVWLLGGGVSRTTMPAVLPALRQRPVAVMTTWNGMDRVGADEPWYFGRPNTWGQRSSNVLLQQADLIVAFGTRLGLQQTGFNWQQFGRGARLVQVDLDRAELDKGHPTVDLAIQADANAVLRRLVEHHRPDRGGWIAYCRRVRELLPLVEADNVTGDGYVDPYGFVSDLSTRCRDDDVVVPCSSGGAFTVPMQVFGQRFGQVVITDKGLASMGYGLSGAIGASLAWPERRTVLLEGDGGFSQNLQELATVAANDLDVKIFLFSNEGYASIRMTQRNYFGGQYLGCDTRTGLGFPAWEALFSAYGVPVHSLGPGFEHDEGYRQRFEAQGPAAFVVRIDPEQTYFPKITSRVTATGSMESQPLHLMSPDLPADVAAEVFVHLPDEVPDSEEK